MSITGATSAASMSHATLVGARPGPTETPPPPGTSVGPDFSQRIGQLKDKPEYRLRGFCFCAKLADICHVLKTLNSTLSKTVLDIPREHLKIAILSDGCAT